MGEFGRLFGEEDFLSYRAVFLVFARAATFTPTENGADKMPTPLEKP